MTGPESLTLAKVNHKVDVLGEAVADIRTDLAPVLNFYRTLDTIARTAGAGIVWGAKLGGFFGSMFGIAVALHALGIWT